MTDTSGGLPERPLSPHLQVWRWHITMTCSILHRGCLMALYAGVLLLAVWGLTLAAGVGGDHAAYECLTGLLGSWLGKLVLFGLTFALLFNLAYTVRQSFWDLGKGFTPKIADLSGVCAIAFAAVGAIVVWVIAAQIGAL